MTGIPNSGPQRGYNQTSRSSRPHSNGGGTYGLSIRVQGIDGHPYVVLNNQDRGPASSVDPGSNGHLDTDVSFIENYQEYEFRGDKDAGSNGPFSEYRAQRMNYTDPQNGVAPSTLLNFQKHPEILQPYDPETNSLNLGGFHSVPARPPSHAQTGKRHQTPSSTSTGRASPHVRSSSLDQDKAVAGSQPSSQPSSQPPAQLAQPQVAQPQSKPRPSNHNPPQSKQTSKTQTSTLPRSSTVSSPTSERSKTPCRSPSSMSSASSSLERTRREPDVLPLRRIDSSGPVLQTSSRSRHSSSSSSSKPVVDEQMEALYADSINRHENRRYIPFLPGSGRDIDTGSIPGVDELIDKFDGKDGGHQRRGRAGRRNRIHPEDRKRSRSVDSGLGLREGSSSLDEFSRYRGTSMEHVLRPSQLRLQRTNGGQDAGLLATDGPRATSAPGSPQNTVSKGAGCILGYKKNQTRSAAPFPFKSGDNTDGSSASKVSSTSLSLSTPSSSTDKQVNKETDVQVKSRGLCVRAVGLSGFDTGRWTHQGPVGSPRMSQSDFSVLLT